jgi:hypothetical protein
MTELEKAARQALEAFEYIEHNYMSLPAPATKAITALREALAEQPAQQEPFGYVTVRRLSQRFENHADQYHFYPAGQSPYLDNVDELHAVYTRPQAREWVGLTDEVIWLEYQNFWPFHPAEEPTLAKDIAKFARAIEAKLREKNA